MTELYWFSVLGNLSSLGAALILLAIPASIVLLVWFNSEMSDNRLLYSGEKKEAENARLTERALFALRLIAAAVTLGTLIVVFVPSKRDLYVIYGLGGTIDYIRQNPTGKQLPDKCIKAIDKWLGDADEEKK